MSQTEQDKKIELAKRYEALWQEFGPSLQRLAFSYEFLPQAREDLLQEILLALWIALPRFRGESSLRTFVFRIAHNRALTHVWRRKRTGIHEDPESLQLADKRAGPEGTAIHNATQERLLQAIRELPLSLKQVMTLALEETSHAEIAEILGISENNVAVRLNRARNLLREKLGGRQ
jgi:RNA polymerase sigma-70 factor (ECF subfamily)